MEELVDYLSNTFRGTMRIELEGKRSKVMNEFNILNMRYGTSYNDRTDGATILGEGVDKYSIQYRLYLDNIDGANDIIKSLVAPNNYYRKEFKYRINGRSNVRPLLDNNFKIGSQII